MKIRSRVRMQVYEAAEYCGTEGISFGFQIIPLIICDILGKKKLLNISKLEFLYLKHGIIILIT